jgi:hypothetical protein
LFFVFNKNILFPPLLQCPQVVLWVNLEIPQPTEEKNIISTAGDLQQDGSGNLSDCGRFWDYVGVHHSGPNCGWYSGHMGAFQPLPGQFTVFSVSTGWSDLW